MKARYLSLLYALITVVVLLIAGGCIPKVQYDKCVRQNETVMEQLRTLMAEKNSRQDEADKWEQSKQLYLSMLEADKQKIEGLLATLEEKNALIEKMAGQLGQVALPIELSNALSEWANQSGSDMITYDEKKGVVRFKSDLLFDSGKDTVTPDAKKQLIMLSTILNSDAAQAFDVLVVGHTDDQPIKYSAAQHPTNWHLSVHRSIAVENILAGAVKESRMAVMGMGEFRPVASNEPGKGNVQNRRVEIYIVPAGQIHLVGPIKPLGE